MADDALKVHRDRLLERAKYFRATHRTLILCTADRHVGHYVRIADTDLIPSLIDRLVELEEESDNNAKLIDRLGDLLTGVAAGLRGPPDELAMHSWHDLPERAAKMREQRDGRVHEVATFLRNRDFDPRARGSTAWEETVGEIAKELATSIEAHFWGKPYESEVTHDDPTS